MQDYERFLSLLSEIIQSEQKLFGEIVKELNIKTNKKDFIETYKDSRLIDLYQKRRTWTVVINHYILPYIILQMGYAPQNEYYRIDVIGYNGIIKEDLIEMGKRLDLTPYGWRMRIAIEHENAQGKWIDEAVKLANIYCPLRVVIGYNRPLHKDERSEQFEKECIKYFFECLRETGKQIGTVYDGKMLILFGQRDEKGEWSKIKYNSYLLDLSTKKYDKQF